jgi:ribosome maturation factor RimP
MELTINRNELEQKFFDLSTSVVVPLGYRLYDLEYISSQALLRVYIMDPNTASAVIEDCVKVDKAFDEFMDQPWIPEFTLEVSSPGMYRKIRCLEHLRLATGEMIKVWFKSVVTDSEAGLKSANSARGKLIKVNEDSFVIDINNHKLELKIDNVKKAQVDPEF